MAEWSPTRRQSDATTKLRHTSPVAPAVASGQPQPVEKKRKPSHAAFRQVCYYGIGGVIVMTTVWISYVSIYSGGMVTIPGSTEWSFRKATVPTPQPYRTVHHPDTNVTRPAYQPNQQRPFFILHVGPPKTATTSLQYSLTNYRDVLERDGFFYLGQIMRDETNMWKHVHGEILDILKNRACMQSVNRARVLDAEVYPLCWQRLRQLLEFHAEKNESIILSEENFAIKYADMLPPLNRTAVDWIALAELLDYLDVQPLVVVGYRRLCEIMPSARQQWDHWSRSNRRLNLWPAHGGRSLEPLFPGILNDTRLGDDYVAYKIPGTIQWSNTDHLLKTIGPYIPIRLLNMHEPETIRTNLICHVLPYAPEACRQSQLDDARDPAKHYNKQVSNFYDALATAAADRKWLDVKKHVRHEVVLATQEYYEGKMQGNPLDLPLICPPDDQLQVLLERSLVKESQLWPAEVAHSWKPAHVASFERSKNSKTYCWIDVNTTLSTQPHWQEFFSSIVPSSKIEGVVTAASTENAIEEQSGHPVDNANADRADGDGADGYDDLEGDGGDGYARDDDN
jgi:hypothetical protein